MRTSSIRSSAAANDHVRELMTLDPTKLLLIGAALSIFLVTLFIGIRRWTGRTKQWADPVYPNLPEIALVGRSPLALIAMSASGISGLMAPVAAIWSPTVVLVIWALVSIPLFLLFLIIRSFDPLGPTHPGSPATIGTHGAPLGPRVGIRDAGTREPYLG
jgi:hypothetical protein